MSFALEQIMSQAFVLKKKQNTIAIQKDYNNNIFYFDRLVQINRFEPI